MFWREREDLRKSLSLQADVTIVRIAKMLCTLKQLWCVHAAVLLSSRALQPVLIWASKTRQGYDEQK